MHLRLPGVSLPSLAGLTARWRLPVGLRGKLLVALLFALLPSLILILASDVRDLTSRRAAIIESERTTAEAVANLVDASIDDAITVGQAIAGAPTVQTFNPSVLDPWLQRLRPEYTQFHNIAIVDARGQSVGEMLPYTANQSRLYVGDQPYFRATIAFDAVQVSPIFIDRRIPRPVAAVSIPIRGPSGYPTGAVLVFLNLDYFRAKLWSIPLGGRVIVITDPEGHLAFASHLWEPMRTVQDLGAVPLIAQAIRGVPATQESAPFPTLAGAQLGVAVPSPRYDWIVAVLQPTAEAEQSIYRLLLLDALSFAISVGFGVAAALYLSHQIIAPLLQLARAADAWSTGNFGVRVHVRTGDELERLTNSLDAMAVSLSATLNRLAETDRRLTQERNRLRGVLETSPAGIILLDPQERVVLANPAAEALLGQQIQPGLPASEFPVVYRLFRPDGTPYRYEELPIVRALREGVVILGEELTVRRPNGWQTRVLVNAAPLRETDGTIIGSVAIFFDVTPLAEEERLRREFVISAAHEFRHPLTVIKGYAEVAMRSSQVQETPVYHELQLIIDAVNRANTLADQLLRAAQTHLPTVVLHLERIHLDHLVADAVERLGQTLPAGRYHVKLDLKPAEVAGDSTLLSEAVSDLLRQAVEAMPAGGDIEVRVTAWDGIATVAVTDHGPPVPSEAMPFLFRPFGVVPPTAAPAMPPRPTLLLYLARRIIEESGGWIQARSAPEGTTISFSMPRAMLDGPAGPGGPGTGVTAPRTGQAPFTDPEED
ncbi:MAG: HAMP domain-containing protein [Chloroflexi bacterium]|nr:HAMP domain-containing protein [Chloroflexota bacterium]